MHEERKLGKPSGRYYGILDDAYRRFRFPRQILKDALAYSRA
jgi:hypothetical protein